MTYPTPELVAKLVLTIKRCAAKLKATELKLAVYIVDVHKATITITKLEHENAQLRSMIKTATSVTRH